MPYSPIKKIWLLVSRDQKWRFNASVLLTASTVLASTSLMSTSAYIISFAALKPSIAEIMVPVTAVRFFGIFRACSRYAERLISHSAVFSYLSELRVSIYEAYANQPTKDLLTLHRTNALQTLTGDIETLQDFFLRGVLPLASSIIIGVAAFAVFLPYDFTFALIFVTLYALAHLGVALLAYQNAKGHSEKSLSAMTQFKVEFIHYSDHILEINRNLRTADSKNQILSTLSNYDLAHETAASAKLFSQQTQQYIIYLTVLVSLIFAIRLHDLGQLNGVMIAVMTLSIFSLYESAPAFVVLLQKMESSNHSAERITNVIESVSEVHYNKPQNLSTEASALHYKDLTFSYSPESLQMKFDELFIESGKKIAIVGLSGSGKSTLAAMLCGLLTPAVASCSVNGHTLGPLDWSSLLHYFSYVDQDVYLFNKGIKDNLRLGNPNATDEELRKALTFAGLGDWLKEDWYQSNAFIGQNGSEISGGQKQRVAVARAYLKNAPYYLLDEAFAGLDGDIEQQLLTQFLTQSDKGLVWITHRLIKMEQLDAIYVVDGGQIIAKGTHSELFTRCELYRDMHLAQDSIL